MRGFYRTVKAECKNLEISFKLNVEFSAELAHRRGNESLIQLWAKDINYSDRFISSLSLFS